MDLTGLISGLSESHLTIGGGLIVAITIVLGIIRGIMRALLGIGGFIAASVTFWLSFRYGDNILTKFTDNPDPWMPLVLAGGFSVATYTAVRHGAGLIFKPLIGSLDEVKKHRAISGVVGLLLGGAGLYGGGSASHQFDTMNFIDNINDKEKGGWVSTLLNKTQESWFGDLQQKTDPTKTAYRCDLIKALSLYTSGQADKYNHPSIAPLISSEEFQVIASKPEIAKSLNESDFQALFQHPLVKSFIKEKANLDLIKEVDWNVI